MTQNKKTERQSLEYYLALKYPISIYPEESGYTVIIPDLPGCMSQGETREEALANIQEAIQLCLEVRKEKGLPLTTEYFKIEIPTSA